MPKLKGNVTASCTDGCIEEGSTRMILPKHRITTWSCSAKPLENLGLTVQIQKLARVAPQNSSNSHAACTSDTWDPISKIWYFFRLDNCVVIKSLAQTGDPNTMIPY